MKTRSISAIGIVLVSVIPAILGGWFFAATIATVFLLAYRELLNLLGGGSAFAHGFGIAVIVLASIAAVIWPENEALPLVLVVLLLVPMAEVLLPTQGEPNRGDWAIRIGSVAYLALPAYAAVSLRETAGYADAAWLQDLVNAMPGSRHTSEGLGWFFFALFITWMGDTFAYLVGRSIGHTKLIPRISPNKTVEGAIGGIIAASITATAVVALFGLPLNLFVAAVLGALLSVLGILGDLFESLLKRRAGTKDSGNAIPGHGGFLDRIDALIWVILASFALVPFLT